MEQHVFNLFLVTNQQQLTFSYRLVDVEGELGAGSDDPDLAVRNLNLLTKKIAFGQKLPVAIIRGGDNPVLAVSAERELGRLEYQLTPHVVRLSPCTEICTVRFSDLDSKNLDIALSFLAWELRGHLYKNANLWRSGANTFFQKRAVNAHVARRQVDVYGGFSPRFLLLNGLLHVAVPVQYMYTDARWADEAFNNKELQRLGGRRMMYHYGARMFPIKFQKRTGKTISAQTFSPEGTGGTEIVFDWTVREAGHSPGGRKLDPQSPAIRYRNAGNDLERFGALALCKLILNNEDPAVAALRRDHQRTPEERIDSSIGIVKKYFAGLRLAGVELNISPVPHTADGRRFDYPAIEMGNGRVIRPGRNAGELSMQDFARRRASLIEDKSVGLAVTSELDAQVLIAPRSLPVSLLNDLKARIERMVSGLIRRPYSLQLVRYTDENRRTLREQVESVVSALTENSFDGGRGILVLPARAQPDLHNYLKKRLRDRVQFQCMDEGKLRTLFRIETNGSSTRVSVSSESRLRSYLLNVVMGLMIVNRQWPWILHEPTHHDAYIGLDVLDHTAAFTFFYAGGRVCAMRDQESSHREKLPRPLVAKMIYDGLKEDLPDLKSPLRSIVLRRDGRVFESERQGFQEAITRLVKEGLLPVGIITAAVEVPKHSAFGVRLALRLKGRAENPTMGSWKAFSETEGIVCTTGWPFNIPGTVEPLPCRIVRGSLDLGQVLEDTFRMAQLCWPTPMGCMRLPIDLKLCDEHLRAFAGRADEDKALFGDEEESTEDAVLTTHP